MIVLGFVRCNVRDFILKSDDRLARFCVAEFFPNEAFDRLRVVLEDVNVGLEFSHFLIFLAQFLIQAPQLLAHMFILFDDREVPAGDTHDTGRRDQEKDHTGQLVPNTRLWLRTHRGEDLLSCQTLPIGELSRSIKGQTQEVVWRAGFLVGLSPESRESLDCAVGTAALYKPFSDLTAILQTGGLIGGAIFSDRLVKSIVTHTTVPVGFMSGGASQPKDNPNQEGHTSSPAPKSHSNSHTHSLVIAAINAICLQIRGTGFIIT